IKGKLHWNKAPMRCLSPEFDLLAGDLCRDAAWFELDFGADERLRALARALDGQTVIVEGVRQGPGLTGESIRVTGLEAGDDVAPYVRGHGPDHGEADLLLPDGLPALADNAGADRHLDGLQRRRELGAEVRGPGAGAAGGGADGQGGVREGHADRRRRP